MPKVEKALKAHKKANNEQAALAVKRAWGKILCRVEEEAEAKWADKKKLNKDTQRVLANVRKTIKEMVEGDHKEACDIFRSSA